MRSLDLPTDYALVLQQVDAEGEEDFTNLAESLNFDRRRLSHIIQALQHKGLVRVSWQRADGWVSLSARGRRLVESLWSPGTSRLQHSF